MQSGTRVLGSRNANPGVERVGNGEQGVGNKRPLEPGKAFQVIGRGPRDKMAASS